jgi:hypothetical protein
MNRLVNGETFSVIVCFVDIEAIVGHILKCLFIIISHLKSLKQIIAHAYYCVVSYNAMSSQGSQA